MKCDKSQLFELKDYIIGIDWGEVNDYAIQSNVKVKTNGQYEVVGIKKLEN